MLLCQEKEKLGFYFCRNRDAISLGQTELNKQGTLFILCFDSVAQEITTNGFS